MNKVGKSAIKVEEMDRKDEIKLGLSKMEYLIYEKRFTNIFQQLLPTALTKRPQL